MTVAQDAAFPLKMAGKAESDIRAKVREALELSHLIAVMNRSRIEPLDESSRIYGAPRTLAARSR
jgi:ABC-type sugar transport system ATPase subunit